MSQLANPESQSSVIWLSVSEEDNTARGAHYPEAWTKASPTKGKGSNTTDTLGPGMSSRNASSRKRCQIQRFGHSFPVGRHPSPMLCWARAGMKSYKRKCKRKHFLFLN